MRTRRPWARGLFEPKYCRWQCFGEFRSEPGYDNRYAKKLQPPAAFLVTFVAGDKSNSASNSEGVREIIAAEKKYVGKQG